MKLYTYNAASELIIVLSFPNAPQAVKKSKPASKCRAGQPERQKPQNNNRNNGFQARISVVIHLFCQAHVHSQQIPEYCQSKPFIALPIVLSLCHI